MRSNTFWSILAIIIIVVGGFFAIKNHLFSSSAAPSTTATTTVSTVINSVSYSCDTGKSIRAQYSQSAVALTLSDGSTYSLPQTESGSGIRYESSTTTGVDTTTFSSEGNNASFTEDSSTTYQDCLAGTITSDASGMNTFTDESKMFSFSYPSDLSVTGNGGGYSQDWMVNATTSGMVLAEIKIPQSYVPGTNFGNAKFTVGTSADPSAVATCLTYNPTGRKAAPATTVTINGITYAALQSSDAGAGNYYDTTSYRTVRGSQCYAIEYTIHYANFQNFPKGTVKQFDEAALKTTLDSIARSFTFLQ